MLSTKTRPAPSSLASDAERPSKKRRLSNSDDENAALLLSTRAIFAQPLAVPRAQSHIHPLELLSMQASLTDSDDDDRSTTDAEDDQDELARDELVAPSNASQLDTTIDYAFLKGHVETPLTVGELPGTCRQAWNSTSQNLHGFIMPFQPRSSALSDLSFEFWLPFLLSCHVMPWNSLHSSKWAPKLWPFPNNRPLELQTP